MERTISIDKAKSVLILTAALVMTVTWGIGGTGWTRGLSIVTFVGLGSIVVSLLLARSLLPGLVAHLFSLIIGIGWSFWVTSRLLPRSYTWQDRWNELAFRINRWYELALQGGTSYDNLMFIFQMGIIIWATGYLTIWFLFRSGRVWPAIVPGGLVLLINLYYAPSDITFWFILYLLISLLLVVRFNLFSQEHQWRQEGTFFRSDIGLDFLRDGFLFSVLVILVAWFTPPLVDAKSLGVFDSFEGSWREMQGEWNRMFADLNYRDRVAYDSFGASLRLGGPRLLTDEPVMDVQVDGIGRYWRAATYDYYTGDSWLTRDEDRATFGEGVAPALPQFEAREPVTQTYTLHRDGATVLYAMANPISLDRSARATFNALAIEQITEPGSPLWAGDDVEILAEEITYIRSDAAVDSGESYQAVSSVSRASVEQLQNAGQAYPSWIRDRYLQLPNTITDRTRNLAQEITADSDNNFDRARAIERYLRSALRYNENLARPPEGVDKVDYVLFESKEAYCDYYASAMIVMLRSLGIPARMAAGFARGTFDSELNAFKVLNRDAHSWVEVYFPTYGWIEFEPTAAQPNIIRPTGPDNQLGFAAGAVPRPEDLGLEEEIPGQQSNIPIDDEAFLGNDSYVFSLPFVGSRLSLPRAAVNGSLFTIGLALIIALGAGSWWWRQQNLTEPGEGIASLYARMVKFSGWMGLGRRPWQTPYEHAAVLSQNLPLYKDEIDSITGEYVYQTYRPSANGYELDQLTPATASQSYSSTDAAWHRLRQIMLKETLRRRLPKWLRN
ncbi:MAG TPA: transglutaminaseTgpA domain-containing protein [Anaerolineae bacterium]|nr:transglutaminaseTgpA domain-containing protein [Anaerolineae bacterium]